MLANVAALPNVARIEGRHHCLSFNEHSRVTELPVALVLSAAETCFRPVSAPLIGNAWRTEGLRERCRTRVRGLRTQVIQIAAGFHVLNIIADQSDRPFCRGSLNIEAREGVQ